MDTQPLLPENLPSAKIPVIDDDVLVRDFISYLLRELCVRDVFHSAARAILKSGTRQTRALNMYVEGAETQEDGDLFEQRDGLKMQGFFIVKPVNAACNAAGVD